MRKKTSGVAIAIASMAFAGSIGMADELRYQFINPSFGGNPFYSPHLLGTAEAQNNHREDLDLNLGGFSSDLRDSLNRPETRIVGDTLVRTSTDDDGATIIDIVDLTTGEVTQVVIP